MECLWKILVMSLFVAMSITVSADNLLNDASFTKDGGWLFWVNQTVIDAGGSGTIMDGKAVAKSPVLDPQDISNIQLMKNVDLDAGKNYKVKFRVHTDKSGILSVVYLLRKAPYTSYGRTTITLESGEKEYECILAVQKDKDGKFDTPRTIRIFFGAFKDATVTVSDMTIEEEK